ncbi:MAG: hypothetical protein OXH99_14750 [Bryobacterales bacterium]|nr:hypothetical protein [Bryobacterales bacterium]
MDVDLRAVAELARYVGSREHKKAPSYAGPPGLRADASCCPPELATDAGVPTAWLRRAIPQGSTGGPWEGRSPGFPRYVWYKHDETVYEGRLVNREQGQYKGYPLEKSEWPAALMGINADS